MWWCRGALVVFSNKKKKPHTHTLYSLHTFKTGIHNAEREIDWFHRALGGDRDEEDEGEDLFGGVDAARFGLVVVVVVVCCGCRKLSVEADERFDELAEIFLDGVVDEEEEEESVGWRLEVWWLGLELVWSLLSSPYFALRESLIS